MREIRMPARINRNKVIDLAYYREMRDEADKWGFSEVKRRGIKIRKKVILTVDSVYAEDNYFIISLFRCAEEKRTLLRTDWIDISSTAYDEVLNYQELINDKESISYIRHIRRNAVRIYKYFQGMM